MVRSSPEPTLTCSAAGIALHQQHEGVGAVVDVQELAPRRAGAPDDHLPVAAQLGLVRLADQRRDDVAGVEVEVVAGAVEIGRHGGDEIAAVLRR